MITRRDLAQRLARRVAGSWSILERAQDIATASDHPAVQRRERRTRLAVIVHHDIPRGRGSARIDVDPSRDSADDVIDQAIAHALAAVGPAWLSTPPAAPAKVAVLDDDLVKRELDAVALSILSRLRRPTGISVSASVEVLRETTTIVASSGFQARWLASALRADLVLSVGHHSLALSRTARRTADLALDAAIDDAAADLLELTAAGATSTPAVTAGRSAAPVIAAPISATTVARTGTRTAGATATTASSAAPDTVIATPASATTVARASTSTAGAATTGNRTSTGTTRTSDGSPSPGRCALWLGPDALLHDDDHGLWTIFAHLADAAVQRQGLTRYRIGAEIAPGASQRAEPLSITSDGALDFARRSAPVTDDAVAIRRFPIIDRGIAVGLGLTPREAALRRTDPNGGVRNLVVAPGTWSPGPVHTTAGTDGSATTRTLEIRRLHHVAVDPYTGEATLDIAFGLEHHPDRPDPTPFAGGTLRLDLISVLARARRSRQLLRRGAYHGPATILIDDAELIP